MFDKFLNRGAEEERQRLLDNMALLEKENENLRKRLSKRETKAAEDPARRQELEESLNKALNRIQVLDHELEVCRSGKKEADKGAPASFKLTYGESLEFIERLSSIKSSKEDLLTVYSSPGDGEILSQIPVPEISGMLSDYGADNGIIVFYDRRCEPFPVFAVIPPFPVESSFSTAGSGFDTGGLNALFGSEQVAAFVLAHAGESFIGVADASNLFYGELVRTGVKEKHSKGGWSQRYERLRDEDIRRHAEKAGEAFGSMMDVHGSIAEFLVLMGDPRLAGEITEGCTLKRLLKTTDIKVDRHCGESLRKEIWSALWFRF